MRARAIMCVKSGVLVSVFSWCLGAQKSLKTEIPLPRRAEVDLAFVVVFLEPNQPAIGPRTLNRHYASHAASLDGNIFHNSGRWL